MEFHFDSATVIAILTILGGVIALVIPVVQAGDFSVPALLALAAGVIQLVINILNKKAVATLQARYGLKK